ncbi:MAG: transporter [Frankiales bacterium]|nr:transporter [Frankiales bacterium]
MTSFAARVRRALGERGRSGRITRTGRAGGGFTALAVPVFRALWLAEFAGDLGNWMQTVGAQWVIVDHPDAILLAALIVAAGRLPMLALAVPAGALSDLVDRRGLLLGSQIFQAVIAAGLAAESIAGRLDPLSLLIYTALLGLGSALSVITFQSLTPQLVPPSDLPSAVAMAQVNLNIARVAGPPLGGLLVAATGPSAVFVLDACSYLVFVLVLLRADIPASPRPSRSMSFRRTMAGSYRQIQQSALLRRNLLHTFLLSVPCSAVWALLPVLASRRLALGATGYGLLLAAIGAGAVCGVVVLPFAQTQLTADQTLLAGNLGTAAALAVLALTRSPTVAVLALFAFGVTWLVVQTRLAADMQLASSDESRSRTISVFQSVRMGAQGLGALGWGALAQSTGVPAATSIAAASMAVGALMVLPKPLHVAVRADAD